MNENFDNWGRLIQTPGTFHRLYQQPGIADLGVAYMSPATETPSPGAVEVWQLFNFTGDTHPIHFHLVNVQLIQRQALSGSPETGITLDRASRR